MAESDFIEIERKFLVKRLPPDYEGHPSEFIDQTYLSRPGYEPTLRARRYGDDYVLTVKKRSNGDDLSCREVEVPIQKIQYEQLSEMGEGRRIRKQRYRIPLGILTVELDIFKDNLADLQLAEVEFPTREEAAAFIPPDWFGEEVTQDRNYSNNYLASRGLPRNSP
jgi:adenylate cyclase